MKIGLRTPSISKRVKARTTAKIKRKPKGAVNPLYGVKGMGYAKKPGAGGEEQNLQETSFDVFKVLKKLFK
jgi:hypothetical protein